MNRENEDKITGPNVCFIRYLLVTRTIIIFPSFFKDPSRNHSVLRALESKLAPPVIPFMPLVTKDAYFLHIGNETYVGDLVNFEKMRLVASSVRSLKRFRAASLPQDLRLTAHKNPDLQHYIR